MHGMQHSNGFEFISVRWGRLAGVLALVNLSETIAIFFYLFNLRNRM